MDLTEILDNIALDLKVTLGTEISAAEATRCINRAVDDLSRHIPREKIYEVTYKNEVTDDTFVAPAAQNDTNLVSAVNGALVGKVDGNTLTLTTGWNDIPRPVKITLTDGDNSITRLTVIIKGTDYLGTYIEERFYRAGGKIQTGKLYFWNITEVELNEIAGNAAADVLTVGTGDITGIWIRLDNPVSPGSESIYSAALKAGTKYTLDTGYEMDYSNGKIRLKTGTTMAAGVTYYANYTKSETSIDISAIIPEVTRIVKVLYPANAIPEQQVAFSIWENMLTIGSQLPKESQSTLSDGDHIAIYYECKQSPPTSQYAGSYPEHLDQIVVIGAAGYALLIEALQYEHQAATDLGTSTTGLLGALANATKYLNNNGEADAAGMLKDITDFVAHLRDMIVKSTDGTGALAAGNAYLDEVDTTDLGQATVGAEGLLATGDDLINQLNTGTEVPQIYADYSRARTQIAQVRTQAALGFFQEAAIRLDNVRSYMEQAIGYDRIAEDFIAEAGGYREAIENDMLLADRFRAEANNRLGEFHELLKSRSVYRKRLVDVAVRQPR